MSLVFYILVNEDVKMSKGKTSAQVAHVFPRYMMDDMVYRSNTGGFNFSNSTYDWLDSGQRKIVLKCSQELLEQLEQQSKSYNYLPNDENNIQIVPIRDEGHTEIPENTLTCVGIGVIDKDNIPEEFKFLQGLRLL